MTELPDDLLDSSDFASFKRTQEDWFLGAAGETIRDYCGWHIAPVFVQTGVAAKVGNAGIIMLPSLNVVSVEAVRCNGVAIPESSYVVHTAGWIELAGAGPTGVGGFVSQWLNPTPLRRSQNRWVSVDFTHGFEDIPRAVAEVGFELTGRTLEKPAGVAKSMQAGPNSFQFNEFGMVLSEDQEYRLNAYRVVDVS